jgi:hypothetical protein
MQQLRDPATMLADEARLIIRERGDRRHSERCARARERGEVGSRRPAQDREIERRTALVDRSAKLRLIALGPRRLLAAPQTGLAEARFGRGRVSGFGDAGEQPVDALPEPLQPSVGKFCPALRDHALTLLDPCAFRLARATAVAMVGEAGEGVQRLGGHAHAP